jgi:RNA polymerase subunit RPABC4/transcription elongation factor Spt4
MTWGVREIWPSIVILGKRSAGSESWLMNEDNDGPEEWFRREDAEKSAEAWRKHASSPHVRYEVRRIRRRLVVRLLDAIRGDGKFKMIGPSDGIHCQFCGATLPHKKVTCPKCGEEYDDCEDWSGPAHPERDCIAFLRKRLGLDK